MQARPARARRLPPPPAATAATPVATSSSSSSSTQQHAPPAPVPSATYPGELRFPDSYYDEQGRLVLKNLTLPELERWCESIGERAGG